jgi:hypothetical protein
MISGREKKISSPAGGGKSENFLGSSKRRKAEDRTGAGISPLFFSPSDFPRVK